MCAILGMVSLSGCALDTREAREIFGKLLVAGMARGIDATGLAWKEPAAEGEIIRVHKSPMPADMFTERRLPLVWPDRLPEVAIGHTRASTKGSEIFNGNNHPLFDARGGIAVVHNGCLYNDDELFEQYKMERDAQVDSEVIPKLISYHFWDGKEGTRGDMDASIKAACEEISGSFAVLILSAYHPGVVWLAKNSSPASICYLPEKNLMLIASVDEYFSQALGERRTWLDFFHLWECNEKMLVTEVGSDTIIRIDYRAEDIDNVITSTTFTPAASTWWSYRSPLDLYDEYLGYGYRHGGSAFTRSVERDTQKQDEWVEADSLLVSSRSKGGECQWRVEGFCASPGATEGPFPCYMVESIYGGSFRPDMCPSPGDGRRPV